MVYSVVKIEMCKCAFVRMHQLGDHAILSSHNFQEIPCVKDGASLAVSEERDEKDVIYNSTLSFVTAHEIKHEGQRLAYRITLADGTRFIMGSCQRPFPVTEKQRTIGEVRNSMVPKYTVTLRCALPLPKQ